MPIANIGSSNIYYEMHGAGEPVLMIPGLGLDHNYYSLGLPSMSPHMQAITVDPRGVGASSKDEGAYSVASWADDFASLIEVLGHESVHVLGTSLGGTIALALALRHPEKVSSLIVVGAFSELNESVYLNYSLRKRLIQQIGLSEEMADFIALWILTPGFIETDAGKRVAADMRANIQQNSPNRYIKFLDAILELGKRTPDFEPPLTAQLHKIKVPTLVACADNDHFIPARLSRVIAERIAGAQYATVPDGGHIPFVERPEVVADMIVSFIQSLKS